MVLRRAFWAYVILHAVPALATLTAVPNSVSGFPTQTTAPITLNLTFGGPTPGPGTGTISFSCPTCPSSPTTTPNPVTYTFAGGATSASTSFRFIVPAGMPAGMYTITATDLSLNAGSTNITLIVNAPSFTAAASPNPLTLTIGGAAQNTIVSTTPDPGYGATSITYQFSGFPAFINTPPKQTTSLGTMGYPPLTFTFSLGSGAVAGMYAGTLTAVDSSLTTKTFPFQIIVQQPDIGASFSAPAVNVCAGGAPVNDTIDLTPLSGYSGAPKLTWTLLPSGITMSPATPVANSMPPGQSIPFTISASPSASSGIATLQISDAAANITKTINLTITVTQPDYTPSATPNVVNLVAGGGTQPINTSITPNSCFTGTVNVTPSSPTAGIIFSPSSGPAPATFQVQALSSVAPGMHTATFTFTPTAGGATKTQTVAINVTAAPDFNLTVTPPNVTLTPGQSTQLRVSATGVNGFNGSVNVTAPTIAGLSFSQTTFSIPAGGSTMLTVTAAATAPPGMFTAIFAGTAPGLGTHTADTIITIVAAPDFVLNVTPNTVTVAQGGSTTVEVSATALNGFTGQIIVTSLPTVGVLVSPATFTIDTMTRRTVTVSVGTAVPLGAASVVFAASSGSLMHSATLSIDVSGRADYALTATPQSLSIVAGSPGTVNIGLVASNGFTGSVTVTATPPSGVTLNPATFTLMPGSIQAVQVNVASNASIGAVTIRFSGDATHFVDVPLNILPAPPVITSIAPPAVATGDRSIVVRLLGRNFRSGARVSAVNPGVKIEQINVINSQIADVTMSINADASPGATILILTNPDGGSATTTLLVYPRGSIAAPLGVTTAAIVFPPEGTMIAPSQKVFPRGLLATTGMGTIVGVWKFDGVPFDRFTVNVGGGYPAEVRTHLPLPISYEGAHTIELQIEQPQFAAAPALHVLMSPNSVSRLTLLAPRDGTVVGATTPLFRWSLVPNSTGYAVELDSDVLPRRIRIAEAQWRPSAKTLQDLGPGIHRWRVRAIFPGETESEPTEWQRFAIIPQHVTLTATVQQRHVRWRGGVSGLLYRVDVLDAKGTVVYSALTAATDFTIPPNIAGSLVRVTAIAPGGVPVGSSQSTLVHLKARQPIVLVQTKPSITAQEPQNGSTVNTAQPHIAATWSGAVKADQIALTLDQTDITAVSKIDATSIAYDALLPLTNGIHTVRLSLGGDVSTWTFDVEAPAAAAQPAALRKDWALTPNGTITVISTAGQPDAARAQFSAQTDIANDANGAKVTGDASLRHDINDPNKTVQESRNWLTDFTRQQGPVQAEAKVGYATASFLDQSELLATGVARGGVEGRIHLSKWIASGYQTFGTRPAGVLAGDFGPKQTIRAAALQTAPNDKWDFRLIGFRVTDDPGPTSSGGLGKAFGVFAKYVFDPKLTMIFEGSHSSFDPNPLSASPSRSGSALRLDLSGTAGTFQYILNLRRTEANYVNPANRGLTPGGVPDRTGANLSLTKVINRTSVSLQLRTLRDGNSSGAVLPRNRENGGTLAIASSIGNHTTLALGGNWTGDRGSGNASIGLPNTDRSQSGANGTVSEAVGIFNLSQTLTVQKLRDHINPVSDSTTSAANLMFGGTPIPALNLSAVFSGTRSEGSSSVGTTDQYLASLQPSWTLATYGVMLQPRANVSRSKNSLTNLETKTEQYQGLVTWAPQRFAQLFSLQVSADATRNHVTGQMTPAKFIHQYVGTFSLKWGAGNGAAMNGTTVVVAPANVNATKTNNPTTTSAVSQ